MKMFIEILQEILLSVFDHDSNRLLGFIVSIACMCLFKAIFG